MLDGHNLQACTILVDGDDGLVGQIRVLMRPWRSRSYFVMRCLRYSVPEFQRNPGSWVPSQSRRGPRQFTPIAFKQIDLAPDIVLHSPMLAKSVSGKQQVASAVGLAHQIQSASSYTSIIATPNLIIELFDCDADGYPMEGMWIQKINSEV